MLRNFLRPAVRLAYVFARHIASTTLHCRRLAPFILVALGCLPITSYAVDQIQSIEVLLSNAPGAPPPDQVVSYFNTGAKKAGNPPLQGLTVESPQKTYYLMQPRASGDFLAWLQTNPDSTLAQL